MFSRYGRLLLVSAGCLVGCNAPPGTGTPSPPHPAPTGGEGVDADAVSLLRLHNAERARAGAGPLQRDARAAGMAVSHSRQMQRSGRMSHDGAGDGSFGSRLPKFGLGNVAAGENIAAGYTTAEAVTRGWMNSSGHRANILNRGWTHSGFGRAGNYWTAVFARLGAGASEAPFYLTPDGLDALNNHGAGNGRDQGIGGDQGQTENQRD